MIRPHTARSSLISNHLQPATPVTFTKRTAGQPSSVVEVCQAANPAFYPDETPTSRAPREIRGGGGVAPRHVRMRGWFDPSNGDSMGFLAGKRLLITGLLSNRSIAYGIAQACHREGAELAFSYVGERFKDRITEFAKEFNSELIFDCDVGSDEQIAQMFADLAKVWPTFDGFVHSIGFAPREAIAGDFLEGLSREGFRIAHDISAYSFPAMAKAALPYLNPKSALLTL